VHLRRQDFIRYFGDEELWFSVRDGVLDRHGMLRVSSLALECSVISWLFQSTDLMMIYLPENTTLQAVERIAS